MSPIELLEKPVSGTPEPKRKAAPKVSKQPKRKPENQSEDLLFFVLFFMPAVTFCFTLAMTQVIRLQIGNALVWEHTADYWASLYKQAGQYFCLALLTPAVISIIRKKPLLPRTSATLAILFMLLSFAFTFGAPKTLPAPAVVQKPAAAPVVIEKPVVKPEPAPEPVAAEPAPVPPPAVELPPAPKHKKGWFILFPIYTKTETALSIIFPLHFQIEKESGAKYFWLIPYTSHTWEADGQSFKNSSFLYPLYTRSEVYSGENLVSAKRRFLFFKKEWQQ